MCVPRGGSPNVYSIHIAQNGGSLPCVRVKQALDDVLSLSVVSSCPRVVVCGCSWIATPLARVFLAGLWLVTVGNSVVMAGIGVVTG